MSFLLPLLLPLSILLLVAPWVLLGNKRTHGGFWLWEQNALMRSGLKGTALVLEKIDLPSRATEGVTYRAVDVVVEVSVPGRASYRTSIKCDVMRFSGEMNKGEVLPVWVDPQNEQRVLIDLAEMERARNASHAAKRAAAEAEKRRLLGG